MGKLDIVRVGNPVLRDQAAPISRDEIGSKTLRELVRDMVTAMRRAPGVGLAAPQLGVSKQVIVLEDAERLMASLSEPERAVRGRVAFPLRVIFNPTIVAKSTPSAVFFEGCLSVPGYSALVERSESLTVTGWDEHGQDIEWSVSGWPARIVQHEVDHLGGVLHVDRMMARTFGVNDEIGRHFAKQTVASVRERLGT